MITHVTSVDSVLPVTLAEAKSHLRINDNSLDEHIQTLIEAATETCEAQVGRSLRVSHTVRQSYYEWPDVVQFNHEPVSAISHVKYYDTDGTLQTVSSSNYRLHQSIEAAAILEWDDDYEHPTHDTRMDAIQVTYTAGYGAIASVPRRAVAAVLLRLEMLFGNLGEREYGDRERACTDLLASLGTGRVR